MDLKNLLSLKEFEDAKEYWLNKLSGEFEESNLVSDYRKSSKYITKEYKRTITKDICDSVYKISKGQNLGGYIVLVAALKLVIYKYTGQNDNVLVSPVYIKDDQKYKYNICVLLRDYLNDNMTCNDLLMEVKNTVTYAYKNQHYPIKNLLESIGIKHEEQSVFRIAAIHESIHDEDCIHKIREYLKNEITFSFSEINDGLVLKVIYNGELYNETSIINMVDNYIFVLKEMLIERNRKISGIQLCSDNKKREIIETLSRSKINSKTNKTLIEAFYEQVNKNPDELAVVFANKSLTYKQLDEQTDRLAAFLESKLGITPESIIGVFMERSIEQIIAIVGIIKAGGAYLPIDNELPEDRCKTIINDSKTRILLSTKANIKMLNKLQWECKSLRTYICLDSDNVYEEEELQKNDMMDIKRWEYIGSTATNSIEGGGWINSYTGEHFSKEEMDEYGDNVLKKLKPFLNKNTKVLEIGCASGISMFRIATQVGLYYGTDLSKVIIEKDMKYAKENNIENIKFACLAAHEIDKLGDQKFDIVILNSVVQCFHGHNYLMSVIKKAINHIEDDGIIFIGDIMDLDLKQELIESVNKNRSEVMKSYKKIDYSTQLFIARDFLMDLSCHFSEIKDVNFSEKIFTIENELTKFRYDAILKIAKGTDNFKKDYDLHKYQYSLNDINRYNTFTAKKLIPKNLAYVIYTSGTTNKPKGVMIEHKNIINLVEGLNQVIYKRYNHRLNIALVSPYFFDSSVKQIFASLLLGHTLYIVPDNVRMDGRSLLNFYEENNIDISDGTPTHISILTYGALGRERMRVKHFLIGGEALDTQIVEEFNKKFILDHSYITNVYGPTECCVDSTTYDIFPSRLDDDKRISIGAPLMNQSVYILDKDMKVLPISVAGELYIGGENVGRGYLNDDKLTQEKFVLSPFVEGERLYKTGDICRWLPEGVIEFIGRKDYQVKIRGFRIELEEVEYNIKKHKDIKESVVISKEGECGEKFLCAYIVSDKEIILSQFKEFLKEYMPEYMIPSHIIQVHKLPNNPNGKIDRKLLAKRKSNIKSGIRYVMPENRAEEKLVNIWQEVLPVEKIGTNDNFFEFGGNSLKAIILLSKIHKEFSVDMPLNVLFNNQTIRELANYIINTECQINYKPIEAIPKMDYYKLSSAQRRIFLVNELNSLNVSYNTPGALKLTGKVNREKLENAFKNIVKRHDAFRTTFKIINGEAMQIIRDDIEFNVDYEKCSENDIDKIIKSFIRPFDIAIAPLLRIKVVIVSDECHFLLYDMHHIISDGVSIEILMNEFTDLYNGIKLPELTIQYKDFAAWQNKLFSEGGVDKQEKFWLKVFDGNIPFLDLPIDYERPVQQSFEGDYVLFSFNSEMTKAVRKIMKSTNTTLYMVLMAVYTIMLSKCSKQEDIIIGSVVAGRRHENLKNVIGFFINIIPIRNFPEGHKMFSEYLDEVKDNLLKGYENQDYPFEELVNKLKLTNDKSSNSFCNAILTLQDLRNRKISLNGVNVEPYDIEFKISKVDILLSVNEYEETLNFKFEYCSKLFSRNTVELFVKYFKNIALEVVNNMEMKISDIEILSEEDKKMIKVSKEKSKKLLDKLRGDEFNEVF